MNIGFQRLNRLMAAGYKPETRQGTFDRMFLEHVLVWHPYKDARLKCPRIILWEDGTIMGYRLTLHIAPDQNDAFESLVRAVPVVGRMDRVFVSIRYSFAWIFFVLSVLGWLLFIVCLGILAFHALPL